LNPRQKTVQVGHTTGDEVEPTAVKPVGYAMQLHRVEAGVAEDDLPHAARGRVPLEHHLNVPLEAAPPVHDLHLPARVSARAAPANARRDSDLCRFGYHYSTGVRRTAPAPPAPPAGAPDRPRQKEGNHGLVSNQV